MNVRHDPRREHAPGAVRRQIGEADWWRGAVIYQVYIRSFQDSNDDGVGDLAGVAERLPYIASLGVDAVWISPFFPSPMLDFGYDVTDYESVDPLFGNLADFDVVIEKAHDLGIKVIIDQVISHTSDRHPWFVESRSDRTNAKANWYVWADAKPDGSPPNNWLSIFGGSAWEWDSNRRQYYLHNFLKQQPDLNFHETQVQDALLGAIGFWLDRGVDGVRLDTINFYFHSLGLEDNPPLAPDLRSASIAPIVNPYNYQDHLYDKNQPGNLEFLRRLRALLDTYPAAAMGEVGDAQRGLEIAAAYTSGNDKVHMCYSFELLSPDPLKPGRVREVVEAFESAAPDGWSCWAFSNHDVMRHSTRWAEGSGDLDGFLKMTATLILSLRGSVCLYQGEELGLTEAELTLDDLHDPYGIQFWPEFKGRDGCRTPMVWSAGEANAGFTNSKPWLPVPADHVDRAVDRQDEPDSSLLNHYRRALAFRARHRELVEGDIAFVHCDDQVLVFERSLDASSILVALNMSDRPARVDLPCDDYELIAGADADGELDGRRLSLPAFGCWFGRPQTSKKREER